MYLRKELSKGPRVEAGEVLLVSSDSEEDPVVLGEEAAKVVEDVAAAEGESQKATSPRTSTITIILEKGEEPSTEEAQSAVLDAVEVLSVQVLPCYSTSTRSGRRTKESADRSEVPGTPEEMTEEVERRRKAEQASDSLHEDMERAKCASVDLLKRLEACQTAYDAASLKEDELQAAAEEAKREYQAELAAQCGELRTQRSQVEEQLCKVEVKLTEAKGKIRQLSGETSEALTARVERCLCGYTLWQIKSHNGLRLREIEHHAAELIKKSGRRHCWLSKKLESYLIRSRNAVEKLEVELVCVLQRLGLERRLEGAATADPEGVGPVRCSHRSR
ncbi:hypothetical protein AXG93_2611s1020 [Marchantia polymorpha subsp. ruderalis]|uniref:Uncharacterized protein n=1 Tax=Marchantia polymorpha subsp. ruderalis TaxID=1480154 RepID=A0A176VJI3_MARPO|nr:hypothetical protein AXG93_2611s1020 [Marchantia polymorpha subsp. ruderalis]